MATVTGQRLSGSPPDSGGKTFSWKSIMKAVMAPGKDGSPAASKKKAAKGGETPASRKSAAYPVSEEKNILEKAVSAFVDPLLEPFKTKDPEEAEEKRRRASIKMVETMREEERARQLAEAEAKDRAAHLLRQESCKAVEAMRESERKRRLSEAEDKDRAANLERQESRKRVDAAAEEERMRRLRDSLDAEVAEQEERRANQKAANRAMEEERQRRMSEGPESPDALREAQLTRRASSRLAVRALRTRPHTRAHARRCTHHCPSLHSLASQGGADSRDRVRDAVRASQDEAMEQERRRRVGEVVEEEVNHTARRRASMVQADLEMEAERMRRIRHSEALPPRARPKGVWANTMIMASIAVALSTVVVATLLSLRVDEPTQR